MDSSTGDIAIDVRELKRKRSHCKGTITKIINFFNTMNDLDLDDMSEADVDNLLKSTDDAISSYKEIQTQLEELILLPNYAGEDVTDPTQAPINKTIMLKVKSMRNSFHAFHTVLRVQARLNHLEAVTSFSSPEAKTLLDHFQQEYGKLERRAKKIKADSFLQEWVSLRECYLIVDHRAQDQLRKYTAFTDVRSDPVTSVSCSSPGHHDSSASHTSIAAPPKAKLPKHPLPVWKGDLQEWRAFWRRFVQVTETCTSDEYKLSYLLESLQDSGAASITKQSISNGDTFDYVAEQVRQA